jgi:hypothetical protein
VQLIIQNASIEPHMFKSDNMDIDDMMIASRSSGSLEWRAPEEEGDFSLYCTDCKLEDQFFTVRVAASAVEFHPAAPATGAENSTM